MKRGRGGVEYEDLEVGDGALAERECTVDRHELGMGVRGAFREKQKQ